MGKVLKAKYAEFNTPNKPLIFKETDIPELIKEEILIQNEYLTLCRSDLNTFSGKRTEKTPTILGHEIVGRIVAFGPEQRHLDSRNTPLNIGDRITWAIYASNPDSELARQGIPQKAPGLFKYGHELVTEENNLHGGLSEYTILRTNTPIAKISENIPLRLASTINCAVATVAGALRLAGSIEDKNVLISGTGMLGIIACAMCRTQGANSIIVCDVNKERLDIARQFGADFGVVFPEDSASEVEKKLKHGQAVNLAIDFSGVAEVMEKTLKYLTIGGTAVWVGATHPQRNLQINAEKIVRNLWTIKGLHNYNEKDFLTAVEFIEKHYTDFPLSSLIDNKFSLEEANEAFEYALRENPFRVGIRINKKIE